MNKLFFLILFFISNQITSAQIREGNYRGTLTLTDSIELPFHFSIHDHTFTLLEADEKLVSNELTFQNDSLFIKMPIFDSEIHCKINRNSLSGFYINNTRKIPFQIPFHAEHGVDYRFLKKPSTQVDFTGKYSVHFDEEYPVSDFIAVFKQSGTHLTGTFLNPTGDFRYLDGDVNGKKCYLSAFDGSHAYYFSAELKGDSIINGIYHSSVLSKDTWRGVKNDSAQLSSPDNFVNFNADLPITFLLPNEFGKTVSLEDGQFKNKPVVLQLMGSWCPNCMDESKFLANWYSDQNKNKVEIIALDFERTSDTSRIFASINRMKKTLKINYTILFAGNSDKKLAVKLFPQFDRIFAYPTLIFLNKEHKIVAVHSGYNGPATGIEHRKEIERFYRNLERIN